MGHIGHKTGRDGVETERDDFDIWKFGNWYDRHWKDWNEEHMNGAKTEMKNERDLLEVCLGRDVQIALENGNLSDGILVGYSDENIALGGDSLVSIFRRESVTTVTVEMDDELDVELVKRFEKILGNHDEENSSPVKGVTRYGLLWR